MGSVGRKDRPKIEVLNIDGGSTDGMLELMKHLGSSASSRTQLGGGFCRRCAGTPERLHARWQEGYLTDVGQPDLGFVTRFEHRTVIAELAAHFDRLTVGGDL
jgi:hypothetical protein